MLRNGWPESSATAGRFSAKYQSDDARDIDEFLFNSAWRSGEAESLKRRDVDRRKAGMIRLRMENSKNGKPRLLPLIGALSESIERRRDKRRLDCPYVFHRTRKQIKSFRRSWKSACKEIGQPNLVPHDMCQGGVRNLRKAGLSESEGMMLSGQKPTRFIGAMTSSMSKTSVSQWPRFKSI